MVDEVWVKKIKQAIELAHGGVAHYLYTVPVHEKRNGVTFWYGKVYVFNLRQGDIDKTMYAWFEELESGPKRFYTVLSNERVDSASAAVRVTKEGEA
jgi:hypothetical protein